jgi:ABC-2 type transport system ATP-binding protein
MDAILEFKNITKKYGKKTALDDVTLSIPRGSIVGLLGPNGSGKTTLLKLATGLLQPTKGEVLACGFKPGENQRIWLPTSQTRFISTTG